MTSSSTSNGNAGSGGPRARRENVIAGARCPRCGAMRGEKCQRDRGGERERVHEARARLYLVYCAEHAEELRGWRVAA